MIRFRTKVLTDSDGIRYVKIPTLKKSHCDMAYFRRHRKFGSYANSNLFLPILNRELKVNGIDGRLELNRLPPCVTVDSSGFLAVVEIEI